MINNKVLSLLGLAKRANKVVTGQDIVLKNIRNNKVNLVFIANDCGKSTLKKFTDKCNFYQIDIDTTFSKQDLSDAIGSKRSIIGITDRGFSKKMKQLLDD